MRLGFAGVADAGRTSLAATGSAKRRERVLLGESKATRRFWWRCGLIVWSVCCFAHKKARVLDEKHMRSRIVKNPVSERHSR